MSEIVSVDTDALESGESKVLQDIEDMRQSAEFMVNKICSVNASFSSNNYDRIVEAMNSTLSCFEDIYERMEAATKYLQTLSGHIEEYSRQKY